MRPDIQKRLLRLADAVEKLPTVAKGVNQADDDRELAGNDYKKLGPYANAVEEKSNVLIKQVDRLKTFLQQGNKKQVVTMLKTVVNKIKELTELTKSTMGKTASVRSTIVEAEAAIARGNRVVRMACEKYSLKVTASKKLEPKLAEINPMLQDASLCLDASNKSQKAISAFKAVIQSGALDPANNKSLEALLVPLRAAYIMLANESRELRQNAHLGG